MNIRTAEGIRVPRDKGEFRQHAAAVEDLALRCLEGDRVARGDHRDGNAGKQGSGGCFDLAELHTAEGIVNGYGKGRGVEILVADDVIEIERDLDFLSAFHRAV